VEKKRTILLLFDTATIRDSQRGKEEEGKSYASYASGKNLRHEKNQGSEKKISYPDGEKRKKKGRGFLSDEHGK